MIYTFILLQVAAHLLADFTFQPQRWSDAKSERVFSKQHIIHTVIVFVLSYLLSFSISFWWAALLIAGIHLLTDVIKSIFQIKSRLQGQEKSYFFIDQFVHLLMLFAISLVFLHSVDVQVVFEVPLKLTLLFFGFLVCSKPANIFVKHVFEHYEIQIDSEAKEAEGESKKESGIPNAGKLIGIMERFLVLALIWVGQYGAVGLIIAAKSILRFQSNQKNEYVLVGTLLSFGVAVLVGIAIVKINTIALYQ